MDRWAENFHIHKRRIKGEQMELGKAIKYSILIESTDNKGFIAKVGCGIFAFSNKEDLKEAFNTFLDEPDAWEDKYGKLLGNLVTESTQPNMLNTSGATEMATSPINRRGVNDSIRRNY